MEEYLTVKELSSRIKYSKQSLYNLISKKKFKLGEHYLKPTPKKILFKWSKIEEWLRQSANIDEKAPSEDQTGLKPSSDNPSINFTNHTPKSSINI